MLVDSFHVLAAESSLLVPIVPPPAWVRRDNPAPQHFPWYTTKSVRMILQPAFASSVLSLVALGFLAIESHAQEPNLLRNSGFEVEPVVSVGEVQVFPVIDGWISNFTEVQVRDVSNTNQGIEGARLLELDDRNIVYQLVDVVPGETYALEFAYSPRPNQTEDRQFEVRFDGALIDTLSVPSSSPVAWAYASYDVVPTNAQVALEFEDLTNGSSGCYVDDISLRGTAPPPDRMGAVLHYTKITSGIPRGPQLRQQDMFARGLANIGDLDGNGVVDLLVGAIGWDDDGDGNPGSAWIIFLNSDASILTSRQISQTSGNLGVDLDSRDGFGRAVAGIGDLDLDGVPDIAIGANRDDDGGSDDGAVYILFLNTNGTVKSHHKITGVSGVDSFDEYPDGEFGCSVCSLGDVDGDGIQDLAIGRRKDHKVAICFMNRDGTVRASTTVADGLNGFHDRGSPRHWFGMSVASMGDFDGNGVSDLLVGAILSDPYDREEGNLYLLLLNPDGTCKDWYPYGPIPVNATGQYIGTFDEYGVAVTGPGDLDGDGVLDIVVGAHRDGSRWGRGLNEGVQLGAIYTLFLNADGTIKDSIKIDSFEGDFDYEASSGIRWGESLTTLGDFNGDGMTDIAAGSRFDGGTGAAFLLYLNDGTHEPARAEFTTASPLSGPAPLTVTFTNVSTGEWDSAQWAFGDGTQVFDSSPTVTHTYDREGEFGVGLRVSGSGGINTEKKFNHINVSGYGTPIAAFSGSPTSGPPPLDVTFADESIGDIVSWYWDFGDGGVSTEANPVHSYIDEGTYSVSLTVTEDLDSSDNTIKVDYISVGDVDPHVVRYGCGLNPVGSLTIESGLPQLGTQIVFGLDNPLGTQAPGSVTVLFICNAPEVGYPCGVLVPGKGMDGGDGERLLDMNAPNPLRRMVGTPWGGPGVPGQVLFTLPPDPMHVGMEVYCQGYIFDLTASQGIRMGLTDGLKLTLYL
jgi:PKD repeat protein